MTTKIDKKIAELQSQLASLEAKKLAENDARAKSTLRVRKLAVALHDMLCTKSYPDCSWALSENPDDAESADWSEAEHALWLQRARLGIAKMRDLGFKVNDPD